MMGIRVSVRMWLTRYWYPSLTYLSLTELEKSGKIGGMFAEKERDRGEIELEVEVWWCEEEGGWGWMI
jgi:hypothetical protein